MTNESSVAVANHPHEAVQHSKRGSENIIPDDWATTCVIYDIDEKGSTTVDNNGYHCQLIIRILRDEVALIHKREDSSPAGKADPRFEYQMAAESPTLQATFCYPHNHDSENAGATHVTVDIIDYPAPWPRAGVGNWKAWLEMQATNVLLENEMSFTVCEFLEFRAVDFFRSMSHEDLDSRMILCLDYERNFHGPSHSPIRPRSSGARDREERKLPPFEKEIRGLIRSQWKKINETSCPICFDVFRTSEMVEITCGHFFCRSCICMYAHIIVEEIKQYRSNPFLCPLTNCRAPMPIVGFVKKIIPAPEMEKVRAWYKDLKNPLCHTLVVCPSSKCHTKDQMRFSDLNKNNCVYCDVCGGSWCENCLQRYRGDHTKCDTTPIMKLCERYRKATDGIKAKCHDKWPWIRQYAASRAIDLPAMEWVAQNASRCPTCRNAIERIEGCFHMQCSNCSTHFCYECGDEIFAPFYGTHHCWMDRNVAED